MKVTPLLPPSMPPLSRLSISLRNLCERSFVTQPRPLSVHHYRQLTLLLRLPSRSSLLLPPRISSASLI
jgi:hypothetical protein